MPPCSRALVATVVPWLTDVTSAPVAPRRESTLASPVMKPCAGSVGVEGVLVVTKSPETSSRATTSVKVPPVSIPTRIRLNPTLPLRPSLHLSQEHAMHLTREVRDAPRRTTVETRGFVYKRSCR